MVTSFINCKSPVPMNFVDTVFRDNTIETTSNRDIDAMNTSISNAVLNAAIKDNKIIGGYLNAINLAVSGAALQKIDVIGNDIRGNRGLAINASTVYDLLIKDNLLTDNGSGLAGEGGISTTFCQRVKITGNEINGCNVQPIRVDKCDPSPVCDSNRIFDSVITPPDGGVIYVDRAGNAAAAIC